MELYSAGNLAKSLAGHDKEQIYVIIREEPEYVYLCNGSTKKIESPKRKNKKHVQPISCSSINCSRYSYSGCDALTDEMIRQAIRHYIGG